MKKVMIAMLVFFITSLWIIMCSDGMNVVQTGKPLYKSLWTYFGG